MELENDMKSMAVKARKKKKTEGERKPDSELHEDAATAGCAVGCGEKPSLRSVMDELFGWGIIPYITDYSACRFYDPFGDGKSSSDGSASHGASSGNCGSGISDFIDQSYRKPNSGTATKVAGESD